MLNSSPSPPLGDLVLLSKAVHLMEGQRVVLNTDILLASDSSGRPEELVYTVSVPPRHGVVHAVQQPGVPLTAFTQLDVAAHRVCYTHDNSHHAESDAFRSEHTHLIMMVLARLCRNGSACAHSGFISLKSGQAKLKGYVINKKVLKSHYEYFLFINLFFFFTIY